MEEIEQRLKEATEICLVSHAAWCKNRKDSQTREKLMEAVHELRKVAARLEIEIAISERDEMAAKPIPIPPHRSAKRRRQEGEEGEDFSQGNAAGGPPAQQAGYDAPPPQQQQQGGGGGHHHNRPPRRRMALRDNNSNQGD